MQLPRGYIAVCLLVVAACGQQRQTTDGALLELDTPTLAAELAAGRVTAERVTRAVLDRIAAIDAAGPSVNSIIEINPDALDIARDLDRRFAAGGPVGPLHGVPVAIKANIDTGDAMATSAGSIALADHRADDDAEHIARLRESGAVIVAKTNLSEWANFRGQRSTSGWSSLGGQTRNPYVLDRNPCGSSSGSAVAVAARIVPLAISTETDGSIVCPANANGVVGIKPTVGLVSQDGIIPISSGQDTAGPMARTVAGAALLLAAMQTPETASLSRVTAPQNVGPATADRPAIPDAYTTTRADLGGIRIGVWRNYTGAGQAPVVDAAFESRLAILEAQGAELVDQINFDIPRLSANEVEAFYYEFKDGMNRYLAAAGHELDSLEALIEFNRENADTVMPHFGQEHFEEAQARGSLDDPRYRRAVADSRIKLRALLEAVFAEERIDALVAPTSGVEGPIDYATGDRARIVRSTHFAAVSGYPNIAVPGSLIGELPISISFIGKPFDEATLVEIAAVFERARGPFPAPTFLETVGTE